MQIALANRDLILQRIASGDLVHKIAQDLGCNRKTITRTLKDDPEYQDAITDSLDARLERIETELDDMSEQDDVPLARVSIIKERMSQARWRAERLNPARWGQRPTVAVQINNGQGLSDDDLRRIAAPLLSRADPPLPDPLA